MTELEQAALYAELSQEHIQCGTDKCKEIAIDYIVQPIGMETTVFLDIIVPICGKCIEHLDSTEWVLLYCVQCNSSQWVYKKMAKLEYGDKTIVWMDGCPKCKG